MMLTITLASLFLCREPIGPACLPLSPMAESFEIDLCRRALEIFLSETKAYAECLNEERLDAINKANRAVDEFNTSVRYR